MSTWWAERNEYALTDDDGTLLPLPQHLVTLLDAVEARFVVTGRRTPSWPDPHDDPEAPFGRRDADSDEDSRLSNPSKYAILEARSQAWRDALTTTPGLGVGLAEEQSGDTTIWTLTPRAHDAEALTLTLHRDPQDGWVGVDVGVGAPPAHDDLLAAVRMRRV